MRFRVCRGVLSVLVLCVALCGTLCGTALAEETSSAVTVAADGKQAEKSRKGNSIPRSRRDKALDQAETQSARDSPSEEQVASTNSDSQIEGGETPKKRRREPSYVPEPASRFEAQTGPRKKGNNLAAGLNFVFPVVHYQRHLVSKVCLGVEGAYVNYPALSGTLKGAGVLVTVDYYDKGEFTGTWFELAGGYYQLRGDNGNQLSVWNYPVVRAVMGWRWTWPTGVNFGFAGGVSHMLHSKAPVDGVSFSTLLPAIVIDFGILF